MPLSATCRTSKRESNPYSFNSDWSARRRNHPESTPYSFTPPSQEYSWIQREQHKAARLMIPNPTSIQIANEAKFSSLAEEWEKETVMHSSLSKIVLNTAYQRIIGMGPVAIPFILRKMKQRAGHWFWALDALTNGESPAQGCTSVRDATDAWLKWGLDKGYISRDSE